MLNIALYTKVIFDQSNVAIIGLTCLADAKLDSVLRRKQAHLRCLEN